MRASELIAALQQAQAEHGDLDVIVLDEELGEWCDTNTVDVGHGAVWREGAPVVKAFYIGANYDR